MKILWVVNLALPEANELLGIKSSPFGGWLVNASQDLVNRFEFIDLTICYPFKGTKHLKKGKKITYYSFSNNQDNQIKDIREIIDSVEPDLIHIFGTEYKHSYYASKLAKNLKIPSIISIQGLVSIYSYHLNANLPSKVLKGKTLRNYVFKDNIEGQFKRFQKRGIYERKGIELSDNIIGRTTWDKAITHQINPNAQYHFCNETLREGFYKYKWNIKNIEEHSIFLSQGGYSIKGLHHMINALPIIKKEFPNVKVYVAGNDITDTSSFKLKLKQNYYGKYIKMLIEKNDVKENVIFTGLLNEKQMIERNLKSHVFVCPSSIENSPNSVGEAMILGVPVVSSYVGGIPDMLEHDKEGYLYQSDSHNMLAYYVSKIFTDTNKTLEMSKNAQIKASKTHNPETNTNRLMTIYKEILDK